MHDFGEILAENRKKKGYSQSDLVDLLSQEGIQVTTKAIGRIERGERNPSLEIAIRLAHYLKVPVEDIFQVED